MDKKKVEKLIEHSILYIDRIVMGDIDGFEASVDVKRMLNEALEEFSKSDWVSVEDELPEYGENVLAISKDGNMNVSYRRKIPRCKISYDIMDNNGFILNFNLRFSKITHWKPIEKLEE